MLCDLEDQGSTLCDLEDQGNLLYDLEDQGSGRRSLAARKYVEGIGKSLVENPSHCKSNGRAERTNDRFKHSKLYSFKLARGSKDVFSAGFHFSKDVSINHKNFGCMQTSANGSDAELDCNVEYGTLSPCPHSNGGSRTENPHQQNLCDFDSNIANRNTSNNHGDDDCLAGTNFNPHIRMNDNKILDHPSCRFSAMTSRHAAGRLRFSKEGKKTVEKPLQVWKGSTESRRTPHNIGKHMANLGGFGREVKKIVATKQNNRLEENRSENNSCPASNSFYLPCCNFCCCSCDPCPPSSCCMKSFQMPQTCQPCCCKQCCNAACCNKPVTNDYCTSEKFHKSIGCQLIHSEIEHYRICLDQLYCLKTNYEQFKKSFNQSKLGGSKRDKSEKFIGSRTDRSNKRFNSRATDNKSDKKFYSRTDKTDNRTDRTHSRTDARTDNRTKSEKSFNRSGKLKSREGTLRSTRGVGESSRGISNRQTRNTTVTAAHALFDITPPVLEPSKVSTTTPRDHHTQAPVALEEKFVEKVAETATAEASLKHVSAEEKKQMQIDRELQVDPSLRRVLKEEEGTKCELERATDQESVSPPHSTATSRSGHRNLAGKGDCLETPLRWNEKKTMKQMKECRVRFDPFGQLKHSNLRPQSISSSSSCESQSKIISKAMEIQSILYEIEKIKLKQRL